MEYPFGFPGNDPGIPFPGQAADSPAINAGSGTAASRGLDDRTTRTDRVTDTGAADLGYHYAP